MALPASDGSGHDARSLGPATFEYGAFSNAPFVVMWVATTFSLTGLAISDTSSAWLMTTMNPDPRAVSLVQVASNLPMFLCTLPAGALADIVEPRRFLIILETLVVALMASLGAVIFFDRLTPTLLLSTNFVLGAIWSLASPAWLTTTPMLVAPRDLAGANAANSVGYNLSRAVGPAVAGAAIAKLGACSPYWLFAAADLSSIAALVWWRPSKQSGSTLTRQRLACAVRIGLRHALKNPRLQVMMNSNRGGVSIRLRLSRAAPVDCAPAADARARPLRRVAGGGQRRRCRRLRRALMDAKAAGRRQSRSARNLRTRHSLCFSGWRMALYLPAQLR